MQPTRKIHAVLTGDIVNSTRLAPGAEKQLLKALDKVLSPYQYEYYRGDSFQAYLEDPQAALRVALLCRTMAIGLTEEKEQGPYDVRISIGIGAVTKPVKKLGSAKGEAFLLSGRSFDEMQKTDTRLAIATGNELANAGLKILTDYINFIFKDMTAKQAMIISGLLVGETQQKLAEDLGKSKSTIYQLTVSGKWPEIDNQLQQFGNLINLLL